MDEKARKKQESYRDARITGKYDQIWQNVGKCAFCNLNDDYVIYEENGVVLTIALYAYIDGHTMIIPRRHVRSVKELTPKEWETMRKLMYIAKKMIRKSYGIKGMQIIQKDGSDAQSTVEHLHFHCVPFDSPDLNTWNYRKLTYTPTENTKLFTDNKDEIEKLARRFERKYQDG
ncbi:MAG TPA: HIT family protein [Candidatus Saccharimonadales bacterium]|nr:HIT family protein [Candidatus Saccharimonadales bacterium]